MPGLEAQKEPARGGSGARRMQADGRAVQSRCAEAECAGLAGWREGPRAAKMP